MKKVLITGANSYIGTSFEEYAKEHYSAELSIDTVDMLENGWKNKNFSEYDCVFHVAGIAHADVGNVSDEVKEKYYQVNTELTVETATKAKNDGSKQFVFMSSMIVYGGMEHISKNTKPQPANFYGDSKWQADKKIRELQTKDFNITVVRPPMIYGKGSKGNYPVLAKLAKKLPVFPKVKNSRSMLHIDNLCEFLCQVMIRNEAGIFFPQNASLVNTSDMVKEIARTTGHGIWVTRILAPAVAIGKIVPGKIGGLCNKAFGSSYYDLDMSETGFEYRIRDFKTSIELTEK